MLGVGVLPNTGVTFDPVLFVLGGLTCIVAGLLILRRQLIGPPILPED